MDWSSSHASSLFGSLIGHIVYGVIVGLLYAVVDRLWVKFFSESDPIRRQPEGPGLRFIRLTQWGAVSGVAGGALYALVLIVTGSWKEIAAIAGGTSVTFGFFIHLVISVLMGASYGLLFQREAPNLASGIGWGLVYGLTGWFIGPLTLFPVAQGHSLWAPADGRAQFPALVGTFGVEARLSQLAVTEYGYCIASTAESYAFSESVRRRSDSRTSSSPPSAPQTRSIDATVFVLANAQE